MQYRFPGIGWHGEPQLTSTPFFEAIFLQHCVSFATTIIPKSFSGPPFAKFDPCWCRSIWRHSELELPALHHTIQSCRGRKWKESSHVNLWTALPHGASITVAAYLRAEASHPWCACDCPCDSSGCALGFFFRKLTSKKTGAGEFKTHNHQTCLLGSSGIVAHLVDLASLFLPKPQHPDLHKMHLEDQIRVGRDQFPRWNLPKSHVALQDLPRRARCHAFGNGTRLSKEAPQNFYRIPESFPNFYRFLFPQK